MYTNYKVTKHTPYHYKNLTLFGCDLSRVIMIDNSPIVCRGEEPNFGKDNMDDEVTKCFSYSCTDM